MSSTSRRGLDGHDLGRAVEAAVRGALNYRGPWDDGASLGRALSASYVVEPVEPWTSAPRHDGAAVGLDALGADGHGWGARGRHGLGNGRVPPPRRDTSRVRFVPSAAVGAALGGPGVAVGPLARYRAEVQTVRAQVTALLDSLQVDACCTGAAGELVPPLARQIRTALDGLVAEAGRVPASRAKLRTAVEVLVGRDGADGLAGALSAAVREASSDLSDLARLTLLDVERQVGHALSRLHDDFPENGLEDELEEYYAEVQPQLTLLLDAAAGDVADLRQVLDEHGFDGAAGRLLALETADEDLALTDALDWLEDLARHSGPAAVQAGPLVVARELGPAVGLLEEALAFLVEKVDECPFGDEDVQCVVERLHRHVSRLRERLPADCPPVRQDRRRGSRDDTPPRKHHGPPRKHDDSDAPPEHPAPDCDTGPEVVVEVDDSCPEDETQEEEITTCARALALMYEAIDDLPPPLLHVWGPGVDEATEWPGRGPDREEEEDGHRRCFYLVPLTDHADRLGFVLHDDRGEILRVEGAHPALAAQIMLWLNADGLVDVIARSASRSTSPAAS